ncbi:MAG: MarC family NAAT transporter [Fluviicola sp.]|nr:MarC family NAAT transporter [Fluviicola sp.]MBP6272826.1 MarC family NAAT transporter [Fluviicola sp.]
MDIFISIFAALFSVINPLGTVPVFVGLTKDETTSNRNKTAAWTSINVFLILIISFFIGKYVLAFFGISLNSLKIAGGLIIATSGFSLLSGSFTRHKGMKRTSVQQDLATRSEVSLTPLAIPMLAGPGSISLLITMNQSLVTMNAYLIATSAVLAVSFAVYLVLRSSQFIVKMLGASGINGVSRIIGFIVIAIGVEYVSSAVQEIMIGIK